ncbi:hypothetical protein D3C78_1155070 [compost metagenome]
MNIRPFLRQVAVIVFIFIVHTQGPVYNRITLDSTRRTQQALGGHAGCEVCQGSTVTIGAGLHGATGRTAQQVGMSALLHHVTVGTVRAIGIVDLKACTFRIESPIGIRG